MRAAKARVEGLVAIANGRAGIDVERRAVLFGKLAQGNLLAMKTADVLRA